MTDPDRTPPQTRSGYIERLLDVIALIMHKPRTSRELVEITGYKSETIREYLLQGVQHGVIYCRELITLSDGRVVGLYAAQPKPHEHESVEVPS